MNDEAMTFSEWMRAIDTLVTRKVGLSVPHLPEQDFLGAYEDGVTPEEFFDTVLRGELDDLGFRLDFEDFIDDETFLPFEEDGDLGAAYLDATGNSF